MEGKDSNPKDHRILGLITIGWTSIGLFIFTIPLVAILENAQPTISTLLPFAVVGGAIGSGILMWCKGGPRKDSTPPTDQIIRLQDTIDQLEERLRSVETINNYEHKLAEKKWAGQIVMDSPEPDQEEESSSIEVSS